MLLPPFSCSECSISIFFHSFFPPTHRGGRERERFQCSANTSKVDLDTHTSVPSTVCRLIPTQLLWRHRCVGAPRHLHTSRRLSVPSQLQLKHSQRCKSKRFACHTFSQIKRISKRISPEQERFSRPDRTVWNERNFHVEDKTNWS